MKQYEYKQAEKAFKTACKAYRDNGQKRGNNYNRRQLDTLKRAQREQRKEARYYA